MKGSPYSNLVLASFLLSLSTGPVEALKIDYDNEFFLKYSKGVNSEKSCKPEEAFGYYKLAHEFKKKDPDSLFKLGLINLNNTGSSNRKASLEQAVFFLSQAASLAPDDASMALMLGKAYQELGDVNNAIKAYTKASNLDPENILLRANLGRLYFEEKDFKSAIEIFNKIILAYPENLKARSYLGAALQATDNYLAAIEQYNFVLQYSPNEYSIAKNLGIAG